MPRPQPRGASLACLTILRLSSSRGFAIDRHRFACARRDGRGCILFPTDAQEFLPGDDEQAACFELVTHGGGALCIRGPSCLTPSYRGELERRGPLKLDDFAGEQLSVHLRGWPKDVGEVYAFATRAFFAGHSLDERDALTHVRHVGNGVGFGLFSTPTLGPCTVFAEYVGLGYTDDEANAAAAARGAQSKYAFNACGLGSRTRLGSRPETKLVLDGAVWVGGQQVRRRRRGFSLHLTSCVPDARSIPARVRRGSRQQPLQRPRHGQLRVL